MRHPASKALESNAAPSSGRHMVQRMHIPIREPEHLTILFPEWVPAPISHHAEILEPEYEQGNVMTTTTAHLASDILSTSESTDEAMLKQESELCTSLSHLSLPNMGLLSIKDLFSTPCMHSD